LSQAGLVGELGCRASAARASRRGALNYIGEAQKKAAEAYAPAAIAKSQKAVTRATNA